MLNIDLDRGEITYKSECTEGQVGGRITFLQSMGTITFTLMGKTVSSKREDMLPGHNNIHDLGLFLQALGTDLLVTAKGAHGDSPLNCPHGEYRYSCTEGPKTGCMCLYQQRIHV